MKETYDILLNLKKIPYEFYEWKPNDSIEHIKVIPIVKISEKSYYDIYKNIIKIDSEFLKKIENKTEIFSNRLIKIIDYACIFYTDLAAIAVEFDINGVVINKSKLLLDEEDEVISRGINEEEVEIKYAIIRKLENNFNLTRKEQKQIFILKKYLDSIKDDNEKTKYIYFECFNNFEEDPNKAIKKIMNEIDNVNLLIINRLISLLKVLKR